MTSSRASAICEVVGPGPRLGATCAVLLSTLASCETETPPVAVPRPLPPASAAAEPLGRNLREAATGTPAPTPEEAFARAYDDLKAALREARRSPDGRLDAAADLIESLLAEDPEGIGRAMESLVKSLPPVPTPAPATARPLER